jgi:hypothetical protein
MKNGSAGDRASFRLALSRFDPTKGRRRAGGAHAAWTHLQSDERVPLPHRSLLEFRALLVGARLNRTFLRILGTSAY